MMMCYAVFSGSPHWHAPPTASPQFLLDDCRPCLIDAGGSEGFSLLLPERRNPSICRPVDIRDGTDHIVCRRIAFMAEGFFPRRKRNVQLL